MHSCLKYISPKRGMCFLLLLGRRRSIGRSETDEARELRTEVAALDDAQWRLESRVGFVLSHSVALYVCNPICVHQFVGCLCFSLYV